MRLTRYWSHGVVESRVADKYPELGGYTAVYKADEVRAVIKEIITLLQADLEHGEFGIQAQQLVTRLQEISHE